MDQQDKPEVENGLQTVGLSIIRYQEFLENAEPCDVFQKVLDEMWEEENKSPGTHTGGPLRLPPRY